MVTVAVSTGGTLRRCMAGCSAKVWSIDEPSSKPQVTATMRRLLGYQSTPATCLA